MAYLNTRPGRETPSLPVEPYHRDTPLKEYDLNFEFPVKPLESNGVRLEPLIPSLHAFEHYVQIVVSGGITFRHFRAKPSASYAELLTQLEEARLCPSTIHYIVYDKSYVSEKEDKGRIAGRVTFQEANVADKTVEVGVCIDPQFQRTHVTTHAVGLLLQYALDTPQEGGLGLRRVTWTAHSSNIASIHSAERLGFTHEGTFRYLYRLHPDKDGQAMLRPYEDDVCPARHDWIGGMTCEDWFGGGRKDHLRGLMDRRVVLKEGHGDARAPEEC